MSLFDLLNTPGNDAMTHVLAFTEDRMKVMAHNVANIDTPGFRMQDLEVDKFNAALSRAIRRSQRTHSPGLDLPTIDQLEGVQGSSNNPNAEDLRGIVFHDDNDRMVEKLMTNMTKNASRQSQATSLLRKQIQLLQSIIREQAN